MHGSVTTGVVVPSAARHCCVACTTSQTHPASPATRCATRYAALCPSAAPPAHVAFFKARSRRTKIWFVHVTSCGTLLGPGRYLLVIRKSYVKPSPARRYVAYRLSVIEHKNTKSKKEGQRRCVEGAVIVMR